MAKKYAVETIIFLTYALFAFCWVAGQMMSKTITGEFDLQSVSAATWSTNAITIAKILGNLAAVWILAKLKPKMAFAFASLLIVAGVVGIWAPDYISYIVSRLVMGFGGALVIVYFSPIVMHYFTPEERPLINGINSIAFNTGNLLALLLTTRLLASFGSWRMVIVAISVASFVILIAWLIVGEDIAFGGGAAKNSQPVAAYTLADGMKDPFNWWLPLVYTGILFAYIAIFVLFPRMEGFAVPAAQLSSLMIGAGMVGTIAGIIAAKKYPFRVPLIRYGGLLMTVCVAVMISTTSPKIAYAAAFLAGFFMFLPMTALTTLPQELPGMTPARVTVVFGMFWAIAYIVETILMIVAGWIADKVGLFEAAVFVAVCSSSAFLVSFLLPETGKQKIEQPASV